MLQSKWKNKFDVPMVVVWRWGISINEACVPNLMLRWERKRGLQFYICIWENVRWFCDLMKHKKANG